MSHGSSKDQIRWGTTLGQEVRGGKTHQYEAPAQAPSDLSLSLTLSLTSLFLPMISYAMAEEGNR